MPRSRVVRVYDLHGRVIDFWRDNLMPTYEYKCDACDHTFEAEQSIKDEPLKRCPKCEKDALKRLISGANFTLQGRGWFKTGGY